MKERVKNHLKAYKTVFRMNLTNFECPNCCKRGLSSYPIGAMVLKDEKYHKYKFYLKCRDCSLVTPAYEDPNKAIDVWEDLWVTAEMEAIGVEN